MSDDEFEEESYFGSIRNIKFKSNFSENLLRCKKCFLMSYIQEIKIENEKIIIYSNCRNNDKNKLDLISFLNEQINNSFCNYDKNTIFNEDNFLYC